MIGKTRQRVEYDAGAGPPRGILQRTLPPGVYRHTRRLPAAALEPWILHYWMVSWDLAPGVRSTVETLPHPNVQLVFTSGDPASSLVHGVHTAKFTRALEGRAQVFGVKFRAGAFRPFLKAPVTELRNKTIPASRVFGDCLDELAPLLTGPGGESKKIAAANAFFRRLVPELLVPELAGGTPEATAAVRAILDAPSICTVEDLAVHTGTSARSLQRLFREHVGVSPKWVIRRFRLHELVERLNSGARIRWADAAQELGYFDQSHLIRDFRRVTGYSPERYRKG